MLQQQNIIQNLNGDKVIAFADSIQVKKMQGAFDKSTINQWYREDPNNNHLDRDWETSLLFKIV